MTEPLNPVLADGHILKRTPSNPLCLPDYLISKHTPLCTNDPASLGLSGGAN